MLELAIAAALFWGIGDYFAKKASLASDYATYAIGTNITGMIFLYSIFEPFDIAGIPLLTMTSLFFVGGSYSFYHALKGGKTGAVSAISSTYAVLVIALGVVVSGERFGLGWIAGAALAIIGVFITLLGRPGELAIMDRTTVASLAATCISWSLAMYESKNLAPYFTPSQVIFATSMVFVIVGLALAMKKGIRLELNRDSYPALATGTVWNLGYLTYNQAIRYSPVSLVAAVSAVYPVITTILSHMNGKERLAGHQIIGIAITVIGVAVIDLWA